MGIIHLEGGLGYNWLVLVPPPPPVLDPKKPDLQWRCNFDMKYNGPCYFASVAIRSMGTAELIWIFLQQTYQQSIRQR